MKRTNVVIDETLIEEIKQLTGIKTTREIIDKAVRQFVMNRRRRRILELPESFRWEGNLNELRQSRTFE